MKNNSIHSWIQHLIFEILKYNWKATLWHFDSLPWGAQGNKFYILVEINSIYRNIIRLNWLNLSPTHLKKRSSDSGFNDPVGSREHLGNGDPRGYEWRLTRDTRTTCGLHLSELFCSSLYDCDPFVWFSFFFCRKKIYKQAGERKERKEQTSVLKGIEYRSTCQPRERKREAKEELSLERERERERGEREWRDVGSDMHDANGDVRE